MSEELCSAYGAPPEPPMLSPETQAQRREQIRAEEEREKAAADMRRRELAEKKRKAEAAPAGRSIPGGGSFLAAGDQPGDPFAQLIVIAGDGLVGKKPWSALTELPPLASAGLDEGLKLVNSCERCVVVCTGGVHLGHQMMSESVRRMSDGIDAFGPGKRIESLLKEQKGQFGSLWEAALLAKSLVKRSCPTVRFGSVRIVTSDALSEATQRAYNTVFSDWRLLVGGGALNGGTDERLDVSTVAVPTDGDAELAGRAASLPPSWFEDGKRMHAQHPSWPVAPLPSPAMARPPGAASGGGGSGVDASEAEGGSAPACKRPKE